MERNRKTDNERAERIFLRINEHHIILARVCENMVDRDFVPAEKDIRNLITDLRLILKALEDDDF